jgi:Uncharacterized conserved protein, contains double-stranded beta-helix domain
MGLLRREFLYLSGVAAAISAMPRTVLAQVQQATAKFSEILRQDLESQGQHVQETIAIVADFGPGTASSWHLHPGAQELFFVSDGRVTLEVEGRETASSTRAKPASSRPTQLISSGTKARA